MANLCGRVLVVLAAAVAACGRTEPAAPPTGEGRLVAAICPSPDGDAVPSPSTTSQPPVPLSEFRVAWVLRCSGEVRTLPDGRWLVQITERADTTGEDLTAQLRQPSDPQDSGIVCTAQAVSLRYFALVDESGRAIVPNVPTDKCGWPKVGVSDALTALSFRTISEVPVRRISAGK